MKYLVVLVLSTTFGYSLNGQISQIKKDLFEMPDVIFEQIDTPKDFSGAFKIYLKQPLDHKDPTAGHLYQKIYLTHKDYNAPTVIITQGYNRNSNRISELAKLLNANQIDVEHRYYGESVPDSIQYEYLNLEQATADLHRINKLFKKIYQGKWVSTGISKGGQTTIYYRFFYPNDVDVSVPYVAPLNLELEEKRIYEFLDNIGTEECREDIYNVQVKIFENREKAFDKLKWYSKGAQLSYTYLEFEEAMEYAILEYPFSFWQWGGVCEEIPDSEATLDEVLEHFLEVSGIAFFSDRDMEAYKSHYYQAGTEMGYYSYNSKGFEKYLKALDNNSNPSAVFMPDKMEYTFDNTLAKKAYDWVTQNGDQFIYINGANDTWSATAVPVNKNVEALWFNLEGKDHGQARIKNMDREERAQLIESLETWLDMQIEDIYVKDDK